jgi:hypothetical protein
MIATPDMRVNAKPKRRLWHAGKRMKHREPRPCSAGNHVGPLVGTALYDAAGGWWAGIGNCRACGSTVHKSQIKGAA